VEVWRAAISQCGIDEQLHGSSATMRKPDKKKRKNENEEINATVGGKL